MKIAIAGVGFIANFHAKSIKKNDGEISAVVEKFANKAEKFAKQHQINRHYRTVDEMVQAGKVDAMIFAMFTKLWKDLDDGGLDIQHPAIFQ